MAKVQLHDNPPDGRSKYRKNWDVMDETALVLIDNPGKWALMETVDNGVSRRATTVYKARYGLGFAFATHKNEESGLIEIWACYKGEEE